MAPRWVVSAFAPVDQLRFGHSASRSGRLQDAERYCGFAHVLPTPCCGGNMLAHAGSAAQGLMYQRNTKHDLNALKGQLNNLAALNVRCHRCDVIAGQ